MNVKKLMAVALLAPVLALCALALPARADLPRPDPSVAEFARGVKFTVTGYAETEVLTNFPVLVRLSTAITGFKYSDFYADGSDLSLVDIGFVDAEGNGLAYDIDTWNPSGESLVWVSLPRMTNGTEFAMWYRSSKTGKALNSDNVWADYTGVWHLNESGAAGTVINDSSTNVLSGTAQGKSVSVDAGRIGGSWRISDVYDRKDAGIKIELDDAVKFSKVNDLGDTFSTSFWTKRRDLETKWCVTGLNRRADGSTPGWGTQIHDYITQLRVYGNGGKNVSANTSATTGFNTTNRWEKIDVIWYNTNGVGKMIVYWNGANKVGGGELNPNTPVVQPSGEPLVIGNFGNPTSDRAWSGELDEVRLIKGVPSAARVQADYDTVNTAAFLTASSVVEVAVLERPVANLQVVDTGASHIQFGNSISSLGSSNATECTFNVKVWKTAESEPADYTPLATGLTVGALTGRVKGLTPETAYSYKIKVTNDESVDSDEVSGSFTTRGVGVSGTGGDITRVGDDWIHYFRVGTDDESVPEHLRHVSEFKIDWAVDGEGKRVWLPGIHFVKVYTGVNQFNGWIGEVSTEVQDAWDLHLLDANGRAVTEEEEEDEPSPYDLDGDGWLTIDDIMELIRIYLAPS